MECLLTFLQHSRKALYVVLRASLAGLLLSIALSSGLCGSGDLLFLDASVDVCACTTRVSLHSASAVYFGTAPRMNAMKEKKGTQVSGARNFCAMTSEMGEVVQEIFMMLRSCILTNLTTACTELRPLITPSEARYTEARLPR